MLALHRLASRRLFAVGASLALVGCLGGLWSFSSRREAPASPRPAEWAEPIPAPPGLGNLHRVTESIYRGEQPESEGFAELKAMGIETVVNLRDNHSDADACERHDLDYVSIPMNTWSVGDEEVEAFLKVALDAERHPIFVHCQHGADRTGTMLAAYRIVVEGWDKETAIEEMTRGGYGYHSIWSNLPSYLRKMDVESMRRRVGLEEMIPTPKGLDPSPTP